jgi:hypothetical protein
MPRNNTQPTNSLSGVMNSPLAIFVLGGFLAFGGNYVSNMTQDRTTVSNNSVRLNALEEYVTEHKRVSVSKDDLQRMQIELKDVQKSYITRDEFQLAFTSLQRSVAEMRQEIRDAIRAGSRQPVSAR